MSRPLAATTEQALRALGIDPQVIAHRALPFFEDIDPSLLVIAETTKPAKPIG